jgi:large subunit ribosomal protein L23
MANKFLIKNPIISERATQMSALGKYVFLVDDEATKPEVKKALEEIYKINVEKVHVINAKPKPRHGRYPGEKPGYKKAIVTLKEGQKLDILPH